MGIEDWGKQLVRALRGSRNLLQGTSPNRQSSPTCELLRISTMHTILGDRDIYNTAGLWQWENDSEVIQLHKGHFFL